MSKVWLITGSSRGLGRVLSEAVPAVATQHTVCIILSAKAKLGRLSSVLSREKDH
jgi:NAD(P)-dependent dehydrogenase (short-subunit alcohol dehydrogenase family)